MDAVDRVVFLGDYLDPYEGEDGMAEDIYENMMEIIALKQRNMEKVVLLKGNHDQHYASERFMELAGRQRFLDEVESASLAPGLRVNISETGLMGTPVSPWETVDVPVALVKPDFSEDDLTSEDGQLDQELKDLLLKNPVFSDDDASHPVYEDPWVVPPVYGARHILAKPEALEDEYFLCWPREAEDDD